MKQRFFPALVLFLLLSCRQGSIGPIKGVLVVYQPDLAPFIDGGGLDSIQRTVTTVETEDVFSWAFAATDEFTGTLTERRVILFLVETPGDLPDGVEAVSQGLYFGEDIWALNQQVIGAVVENGGLPEPLADLLEEAYNTQVHRYIYGSFVNTQMSSPERLDSLGALGFTIDVPKAYATHIWRPDEGFIQYQRVAGEECLLMLSVRFVAPSPELTDSSAIVAREAMARRFFYDASADSVDRSMVTVSRITFGGMSGISLTGMWRNPEYLNAGAFTSRILDSGERRYIMDLEVYNPGREKEPYLREGWVMMDTFREGSANVGN
ncbi:MAG: DUF4837 family protein [Candidatus Fermentibacteraceae bacterium]